MEPNHFTFELSDSDIQQIAASLEFHYKYWPGYPAAEKEEQERLWRLRAIFRTALMEVAFHRED
jgi:hypothetical protein